MGGNNTDFSEAAYPHISYAHQAMLVGDGDYANRLSENLLDLVDESFQQNPYSEAFAYDPEDDVERMQEVFDEYKEYWDDQTPLGTYSSLISKAFTEIDAKVDALDIDTLVGAHETKTANSFARSVNRFTAGMRDANAVNSSAFVMGLALLESDRQAEMSDYRGKLELQNQAAKNQLVAQSAQLMVSLLNTEAEHKRAMSALQGEISRLNIIAQSEFLDRELEYDVNDVQWKLDQLTNYFGQGIGAMTGTPVLQRKPSRLSSGLSSGISTAASLAAAAAPLGAAALPIGIAGGVLGGLAGGLA